MKVRYITQSLLSVWFGWLEVQALSYMKYIKEHTDIDIDFIKWDEKDIDIIHIFGINRSLTDYIIKWLRKNWTKIVVSPVFYLYPQFLEFRKPSLYKLFSYIPFHTLNWVKETLNNSSIILPNSNAEWEQISWIYGISKDKIQTFYNWVNKDYLDGVNNNIFFNTYWIENFFLCVSHIEPRKNHLNMIKWYLKSNVDEKLVLFWNYRWSSYWYHNEVKNLITKSNWKIIHIQWVGHDDEILKSAFLSCKAYVLASYLETPWLASLEAQLAWKPLILWDCPPVREYFWNNAIFIKPNSITQISNAFENIRNFSAKNINEKFYWENILPQLEYIYKSI